MLLAVMAQSGWFSRVDLWARRLLAPPSTQIAQVSTHEPTQASQRFFSFAAGFLATAAISLALVTVHRGGLVPILTLLCVALAANAPMHRRKYCVIGVLAVIPLQIIVALFLALFPWH